MTGVKPVAPRRSGSRSLLWLAILSLLIGAAPAIANIGAEKVAAGLGCYISEFQVYTRSPADNYDSYDEPGCRAGRREIGPILVMAHNLVFAFVLTWPFLFISLALWLTLLVGWARRRRA